MSVSKRARSMRAKTGDAPPDDTGEALGLPPAGLTLTIGFGASLFDDRFGLAGQCRREQALVAVPGLRRRHPPSV